MMKINTSGKKIEELLKRGVENIIEKESLRKKLKSGKRLVIKHGIDPTGPKIHLGRALQFKKLKEFQDLGHKIVLIIGDFTAQIGDASDKKAMRKPLSEKEVKENMKDYKKQIAKILDLEKAELLHNGKWLKKLKAGDLIRLSMNFTAQQMIQRRNFKERWEAGKPIGLHELDYPLFQGYDSFMVKADAEIGGTDQLFNLKAGRSIQSAYGQPKQDIITLKMLPGLDGRKMSTSWGNMISIVDSPKEMYGKIMSMKDELLKDYFELTTRISFEKIKKNKPRDLKAKLAKEIVAAYHSGKAALAAEKEFERIFKENKKPLCLPEVEIKKKRIPILALLAETKIASSKSEAKRLILQKGIKINGEVQKDWKKIVEIKKNMVIQAGKRKFVKIN